MKKISIIMHYSQKLSYDDAKFNEILTSIINQNYQQWELIILDYSGQNTDHSKLANDDRIIYLSCDFINRATVINTALNRASGDYIMLVDNLTQPVKFRLSTIETFLMVAERNQRVGMVYSDYRSIDKNNSAMDIHLLDPHIGRVRDSMDYGAILFFPKSALTMVNGLNESYERADLYDLILKLSTKHKLIHINAAANGYTYIVEAKAKEQDIFGYIKDDKKSQLELEHALTDHLKRIGAYLEPGFNYHEVYNDISYSKEELAQFETCIASVVIPVFNREEFIATAIESVQAQTTQNVEVIIVVNGGPNDPTIRGVKPYLKGGVKYDPGKPAVKLIVEDINNLGLCLNKGINHARGKYYIQLDSDDRLKPDAVEKILAVFNSDPRIAMVIGSYEVWEKDDQTGKVNRKTDMKVVTHDEWTEENGRNNLLRINGAGAPRAFNIKIFKKLSGFGMNDSDYCRNYGEDYDLVLRISEKYRIGRVWEPIYDVVRHSGGTDHSIDQLTIDRNDNAKDHMRKEAIMRRKELNLQR